MFGPKSYLHGGGINGANSKSPIVYFDVRVNSPYKDLILIAESQLETQQYLLNGKLVMSINEDLVVKKISMRLIGRFKLDFLQLDHGSGVTSIVKDQKIIFEANWNNLLVSPHGEVIKHGEKQALNHSMRSFSSPVVNRLIKKKSHSPHLLELPSEGCSGTPFTNLDPETSHLFHLRKGNYELPFQATLPPDIPDTIEGLQSGSVLYNFEAMIVRPPKMYFHGHGFTTYKYLRIFRTLTADHLTLQQDVAVGNTYVDKLQYKISIPSKAVPLGGATPINIELFPFKKGYRLEKIAASLVQFFVIRDSSDNRYDDQMVLNKQSMTAFGDVENVEDSLLLGNATINSLFQLPHNLKKITQDVECASDLIHVKHKIAIQVMLRHVNENKTLEIKANLPVLLYVSPDTTLQGRLVLLDNNNGNIHFRPNEFVDLFDTSNTNSHAPSPSPAALSVPPPNYRDRLKDSLLNSAVAKSAPVSPRLSHVTDDHYFAMHSGETVVVPPVQDAQGVPSPAPETSDSAPVDERCQVPSYEQTMQLYPG